ncbi:MAG: NmrA family NAD(P)-binding protein [Rhizobiaceae bacterium]|nr:NmrA family NAD(P)-binding protein [Rhizobiaceae bacterium]
MSDTIFITGASGKLGRAVIDHLLADQNVSPARLIVGSRSPDKLSDLVEKGVTVRKADFDDTDGLSEAFAGADTVLIVSTDALDGAGTRLRQHRNAVAAAKAGGVKRIAYTSLPRPDSSKVSFAPDHLQTEEAIKATGLLYLLFRNCWYQENLFMSLPTALASGQWYTSAGDGKTSFVARDDIAAAIAAALANPPAASKTYTMTGTEALDHKAVAELVASVTGKPLEVVNLTDEQLAGGMKAAGVPEPIIPTLVSFDAATRAGDLSDVTTDVEDLSGRTSKSLKTFIEQNKAALGG